MHVLRRVLHHAEIVFTAIDEAHAVAVAVRLNLLLEHDLLELVFWELLLLAALLLAGWAVSLTTGSTRGVHAVLLEEIWLLYLVLNLVEVSCLLPASFTSSASLQHVSDFPSSNISALASLLIRRVLTQGWCLLMLGLQLLHWWLLLATRCLTYHRQVLQKPPTSGCLT